MRRDPIRQHLAPRRVGIREARGAERGDEDLRRVDLAGMAVDDLDGLPRVVDEQLLAGDMDLAKRRLEAAGPGPVPVAEPADMWITTYFALCCGPAYVIS